MKPSLSLIPQPASCVAGKGRIDFSPTSSIAWKGRGAADIALLLAEYLRPATGWAWEVGTDVSTADIVLTQTADPKPDAAGFLPEGYTLCAKEGKVAITAASAAGLARGIQTLRQLFPAEIYAGNAEHRLGNKKIHWHVPCVTIEDAPQFRWRGQHLDVARHFFSVKEVCRYIELMAQHRMNIFHLHLTDDQGWRIEIKRYPKLTSVGAWRETTICNTTSPQRYDGKPYGGFFTQEDIKTIVGFAQRRHITVVPEIDMPGHMQAAIAAYPELGNTDKTVTVWWRWGISQTILNPEMSTIHFMKNVLDEVMALFPSTFIHIGGDEALKWEWCDSRRVHELMHQRKLKTEDDMQSWFIKQINTHILKRGRRAIGWDEILEGGLAKGIGVMAWRSSPEWRGDKDILQAVKQGNDVVIASGTPLYFDLYNNKGSTMRKFYDFTIIPTAVPAAKRRHILGAQGEVWSENVKTFSRVEYKVYPRACALAEILWTPEKQRNYAAFQKRLRLHSQRLDIQNVNAKWS